MCGHFPRMIEVNLCGYKSTLWAQKFLPPTISSGTKILMKKETTVKFRISKKLLSDFKNTGYPLSKGLRAYMEDVVREKGAKNHIKSSAPGA